MRANKNDWDLWRVVAVVSLSVAGFCCVFLACLANALLPTMMFGFTASFLLFSAAYEAATGKLILFGKKSNEKSEETGFTDKNFPSLRNVFKGGRSAAEKRLRGLREKFVSFFKHLKSYFTGFRSIKKGPSARQRKIWFEDILASSAPEVKKSLKENVVDLQAVLEAEKRGRNRGPLVEWLEEKRRAKRK